jgi:hypothetical protein
MNIDGDVLVDSRLLPHVKARHVNEDMINCRFVAGGFRAAVVATWEIRPGEELFASHGDACCSHHGADEHSTKCSNNQMSPFSTASSLPPLSSFLIVLVAFEFLCFLLVAALPGL